jgi:hypothetical protein
MPRDIQVAAYYFPHYHSDRRNDAWHGAGWTEWELVKRARARFPGHRQPIVPAWGYFDESDPAWASREVSLASVSGVDCFLYDWYYYEDGPFLQDALEQGFLRAGNSHLMKFALMWANHDWQNIHPASFTNRPDTLAYGRMSRQAFERMTDYIIDRYFPRPNYWAIDGEPYFCIYELGTFISGLGGLEQAREALDSFREKARAAGFPGLHLNACVFGLNVLPSEVKLTDPVQVVEALGLSSVGSYVWVHHCNPDAAGFPQGSYAEAARRNYEVWEENLGRYPVPYHPNVTMGWDPSPRTIQSDRYEPRGYPWTACLAGNTPTAFKEALRRAKAFVERDDVKQKIVTLNAWNEWTEGSYLLPDTVTGTRYLEAVREVFGR